MLSLPLTWQSETDKAGHEQCHTHEHYQQDNLEKTTDEELVISLPGQNILKRDLKLCNCFPEVKQLHLVTKNTVAQQLEKNTDWSAVPALTLKGNFIGRWYG